MADTLPQETTPAKELEAASCGDSQLVLSLLMQLECPVCYDVKGPPIFMCRNGHNVCHTCKEQTNECATCRAPGQPSIRNRFAEQTFDRLTVACPHSALGCRQRTLPHQRAAHALACAHAPVACALCQRAGALADVLHHLHWTHASVEIENIGAQNLHRSLSLSADVQNVVAVLFGGKLFWLAERYDSEKHTFCMQFFAGGPDVEQMSDYFGSVRFTSNNFEEELTMSYPVPLGSEFSDRFERCMGGKVLAALAADGTLRYDLGLAHKDRRPASGAGPASRHGGGDEMALAAMWVSPDQWVVAGPWAFPNPWVAQAPPPDQADAQPQADWPNADEILGPWDVPGAWVDLGPFQHEEPFEHAVTPQRTVTERVVAVLAGSYPLVVGCGLLYVIAMR